MLEEWQFAFLLANFGDENNYGDVSIACTILYAIKLCLYESDKDSEMHDFINLIDNALNKFPIYYFVYICFA